MNIKMQHLPEIRRVTEFLDSIHDDNGSLTLSVGNECLDHFFDDTEKAIENFPSHSYEIALTSICRKMNEMNLTDEVEGLFNHVLDLIQINDQVSHA